MEKYFPGLVGLSKIFINIHCGYTVQADWRTQLRGETLSLLSESSQLTNSTRFLAQMLLAIESLVAEAIRRSTTIDACSDRAKRLPSERHFRNRTQKQNKEQQV